MKEYLNLSSDTSVGNAWPMSDIDFKMISADVPSRKEAISKSVEAITILLTRVMTVDAAIDVMRRRAPFINLGRAMDNMSRICEELTKECIKVYEFCVADNVMDIHNRIEDENRSDIFPDVAAEPPSPYGSGSADNRKA